MLNASQRTLLLLVGFHTTNDPLTTLLSMLLCQFFVFEHFLDLEWLWHVASPFYGRPCIQKFFPLLQVGELFDVNTCPSSIDYPAHVCDICG
jgi:hypothetical protein